MSTPSYNALRAFEAVVRLGSVKAASEELYVTQSAISHQLRQLEDSLNLSLLQRNGRTILATPAGLMLNQGLQDGFERIHSAVREVQNLRLPLTIACLPSIAARWLVPKLALFRQSHPDIQLRIQYSVKDAAETAAKADIRISWLDGSYIGNDAAWRLFNGATYPVCSPLYLDRFGPVRTPADLLHADLLHDETINPWADWFQSQGLDLPLRENETVFEDFNLMSFSVLAGHGVALAPLDLLQSELNQGLLKVLFDTAVNVQRNYWIVSADPYRVETMQFINWMLKESEAGIQNQFGQV